MMLMLALREGARYNWGMLEEWLAEVQRDYPELKWRVGRKFAYRGPRTISYIPLEQKSDELEQKKWQLQLLHELGHARLKHQTFQTDLERLKMECAAWEEARELALRYGVEFDEELMEEALDSYRDWLHGKAKCAQCGLTRYQTKDGKYHCPGCEDMI